MGVIEKQSIQDIADAIRDRNGLTTLYKPRQMDEAIRGLYKTEAVNHVFDNLTVSTTKENTSFTLDDAEGEAEITELKGNTTQEGTPTPSSPVEVKTVSGDNDIVVSNKNLFDYENTTVSNSYSTVGTKTNNGYLGGWAYIINLPRPIKVGTYFLSYVVENVDNNATANMQFKNKNGTTLIQTNAHSNYSNSITFNEDVYTIRVDNGKKAETTLIKNIQLEKGTTATTYIEHQGNSYRVDLGGKNLLNLNATQTKSGVTCTNNGDGSITLNGTATANMDLWIANGTSANVIVKSMPNGTALTQRINVKSGSYIGTAYFETVTYNGTTNNYTNLRGDVTYTFTYDGWIKPTEVFISNGSVFDNWTIQPQLEKRKCSN